MKSFSIASLNLHHFKEWEERLPKITDLLLKTNADVVLLQEVRLDPRFDVVDQADLLNSKLLYPYKYKHFSAAETRTSEKGRDLPFPVERGLGVLSKHQIKDIVVRNLIVSPEDNERKIAVTYTFFIEGDEYKITNVHFYHKDDSALIQFKEILEVSDRNSIIMGDFNIHGINFETYKKLYQPQYVSSYDSKKYTSFPSEGDTFDYALVPTKTFLLKNVICRDEDVSDHRMLIIEVSKK